MWVGLAAGLLGVWSQRYRFRRGRFLPPERGDQPRKALVTGASSGIGAAFSRRLAAQGYDLILVARRTEHLQALSDELAGRYGVSVEVISADLTDPGDLQLVQRIITAQCCLDLLVSNAGFGYPAVFARSDSDRQQEMLRLHNLAALVLTRAALPGMVKRGRGGVILTSSLAGILPLYGNATYSASKAYLNTLAEAIQLELDGTGVYIQSLCPGFTRTELMDKTGQPRLPGFMWMDSDDVARQSLESLGSGEVIFIPGALNRLLGLLSRLPVAREIAKQVVKLEASRY